MIALETYNSVKNPKLNLVDERRNIFVAVIIIVVRNSRYKMTIELENVTKRFGSVVQCICNERLINCRSAFQST